MKNRCFVVVLGIFFFSLFSPVFAWDKNNSHPYGENKQRPFSGKTQTPQRNPKGYRDKDGNLISSERNTRFKANPGVKAADRIGSNSPIASKNSPLKNMQKTAKIKEISVVASGTNNSDDKKTTQNDSVEKAENNNIEINIYFSGPANPLEFSNAEIIVNGVKINNDENIKYNRAGTKARITISQSEISDLPAEYNISIIYPSGITDAYIVSAKPVQNKKLN
jgi:hypothetical protein